MLLSYMLRSALLALVPRRIRRQTAVMGSLFPGDRWLCDCKAVTEQAHVQALKLQGFEKLLVPDEEEAVAHKLRACLREEGVILVTASGEEWGGQQSRGEPGRPEYCLIPMLREVLLIDGEDDEGNCIMEDS